MTEFRFESEELETPEVVSEFSMEDYEKYRLKTGDITVDLAIVDLDDRDADEYIDQRKNEISDSETEVPHPYKPQKQSRDEGADKVEFSGRSGKGFADPEYNLVSEDEGLIVRYDYFIVWKEFEDEAKLVEKEVYTPKGDNTEPEDIAGMLRID